VKPETLHRIRSAAHQELARSPSARPWWYDAALLVAINSGVAIVCALYLGWPRLLDNSASRPILVAVAIPVALVIVLGAVASVMPGRRAALIGTLVLAVAAAVAIVSVTSGADTGRFVGGGVPCMRSEWVMAIVPTAAAVAVLSRFAYSPLRMLVGALSGGATGLLVLHLHCRNVTLPHVAVFHVLPWLAAAGIAVLIRSRIRSRSFAP
jgi:hypothetical protein